MSDDVLRNALMYQNSRQTCPLLQLKKPMRKSSKAASVTSAGSRKSAKAHLELQLQRLVAEQTLLEEKKKLMEKHFNILEELVDLDDEEAAEEEVDANAKAQNCVEEECSDDEEEEEGGEKDSSDDFEEETEIDSSDDSSEDEKEGTNDVNFNPKDRSTPAKKGEASQNTQPVTD
ncbi:glutamic acid-rich protein-like [Uranotaenia lowii]|uniref:glutamic acid-rich protein-like n=1 Tax=Uranotaenia lowii TaxID=190385 RepID=UPI0024797CCA|nr:glutamic acid-rich protein-like [Uranotaenia lowii]